MATVAAVFTRAPWVRTPEQVVESLFRIERQTPAAEQKPPRPENKRVWASLLKGKTAVMEEVAQEMQRRDPQGIKTRVAVTDGERSFAGSGRRDARGHPDPGSVACSGEALESRVCVPRRGEPGSGTLGSGPHPAHPVR